jgi:hypothetical protein
MEEHVDFQKNQKSTTWIWVVVGAVVLCLACAAVGVVAGAILYFTPASSVIGSAATRAPTPAHQVGPTAMPYTSPTPINRPVPPSEVVVEPQDPNNIPLGASTLFVLTPSWQSLSQPGENAWQTSFAYDQSIVVYTGWCTATQATLEQNFAHITFTLGVDGQDVPVQGLTWADEPGNGGYCRSYYGLVAAWPIGDHIVVQTMRFDQAINDGWSDYAAGDYLDVFQITATP